MVSYLLDKSVRVSFWECHRPSEGACQKVSIRSILSTLLAIKNGFRLFFEDFPDYFEDLFRPSKCLLECHRISFTQKNQLMAIVTMVFCLKSLKVCRIVEAQRCRFPDFMVHPSLREETSVAKNSTEFNKFNLRLSSHCCQSTVEIVYNGEKSLLVSLWYLALDPVAFNSM